MKFKEKGYVLSVDPASNLCGVSLWKDGDLVAWTVLKSKSNKDPFSERLKAIKNDLDVFLSAHLIDDERVETVICEGVRSSLVQISLGALFGSPWVVSVFNSKSFVHSTSWKYWAKLRGAKAVKLGDIKGISALKDIGWDFVKYPVDSDDVADSLLIYMTWRDKK